jgi:hypothetical protein
VSFSRIVLAAALLLVLPAAAAEVADLHWMAGHWSGTTGDVATEEHWTSPGGTMLLGMHRDVGKRTHFEFMRIEQTKDGLVYFAQPSGKPQTPFALTESSTTRAVFSNPEHDFPQRIIYWLDEGRLCARVEGKGEAAEEWCWTQQ